MIDRIALWRGRVIHHRAMNNPMVQRRQAALIYLFPALQDLVVALIFFVGSVRAARWGGGATKVALVAAAWSVVYVCACPVIGRLVTARNAHRLALSGCLLLTLVSGLLAVVDGFEAMLVLVGVSGLATALFHFLSMANLLPVYLGN